jgi:predicted neuraminidase
MNIVDSSFLQNPSEERSHSHCATLVETKEGTLIAAWYAYQKEEHIEAALVMARKPKDKKRWESSKYILGPKSYSLGNPVRFQEPGGRLCRLFVVLKGNYWNSAVLNRIWSEDEGQSWSEPCQLFPDHGLVVRHPPLQLDNGSLLLPAYDEAKKESLLLTSNVPYDKWEKGPRFDNLDLIQPVLVREKTGRLSLYFRPGGDPRCIWRSHLINQSNSWTTPLRTSLKCPLSGIAAFTVGDNVAIVHNPTDDQNRYPISISVTRNGGTDWGEPMTLDSKNFELSYPSFITGKDGSIHGVYTFDRKKIKYVNLSRENFL